MSFIAFQRGNMKKYMFCTVVSCLLRRSGESSPTGKQSQVLIFLGGIFILHIYNNKDILINLEQVLKLVLKKY